jgi:hypothetical protein
MEGMKGVTKMKTKNLLPIFSFLLLTLVGCGKNEVELSVEPFGLTTADPYVVKFTTKKPLAVTPIVEYTVTKNGDVDEYMLMPLKKADVPPKAGVRRAEVSRIDDRRFSVEIPAESSLQNPSMFFFNHNRIPSITFHGYAPARLFVEWVKRLFR